MPGPPLRAVVVGAGAAGAAAANALLDAGVAVTIVESRERVGGRTCTVDAGGVAWDLGGSWVEGCGENEAGATNPIMLLAAEYDIATRPRRVRGGSHAEPLTSMTLRVTAEGRRQEAAAAAAAKRHNRAMAAVYRKKEALLSDPAAADCAVDDVYTAALNAQRPSDPDVARWAPHCKGYSEGFWGAPLDALSCRYYDLDDGYDGGHALVHGGYGRIIERHVQRAVARGASLRLGARVCKVVCGDDEVPAGVRVHTADGGCVAADYCVVTVPLGVLKAGAVRFAPALPVCVAESVARLGVGSFNKIFVRFAERFWDAGTGHIEISETLPRYRFWMPLWYDSRGEPVGDDGPHTLMCLLSPQYSKEVDTLPDDAVRRDALEVLGRAVLPRGATLPEVVDFRITRWGSDLDSLGPFSTLPPGATPADLDALAQPLAQGQLYLAGEHTNAVDYCSVHGAHDSGVRAARQVVAHAAGAAAQ